MASTVYDIKLRYLLDDKASRGAAAISKTLHETSKSAMSLRSVIGSVGVAAAGFFGASAAKGAFIDFNSNMEQARIQMAGMLKLNVGGSMEENFGRANQLVSELQQRAKSSVGTTKDFVDVASMLVRPLAAANVPLGKMGELTQGVVVASQAFGIASDVAARDVEAALMGQMRNVDRFSRSLGLVPEEFNKLSEAARAAKLTEALTQPAIAQMAQAQATSFAGVISTLQDAFQMTLGKIGLPLFQAITEEVKRWNAWIDSNGEMLARVGKDFGQTLVEGFQIVKSVMAFFVEHRDTLMMLAKMWIGAKLIGGGAKAISSGIGAFGNMMTGFKDLAGSLSGGSGAVVGLRGLTAALGPLTIAVGLVAGGIQHLFDTLSERASERTRMSAEFGSTGSQGARLLARASEARKNFNYDAAADFAQRAGGFLKQSNLLTAQGQLKGGLLAQQLSNTTAQVRAQLAGDLGIRGFSEAASEGEQATLIAESFRKMFADVTRMIGPEAFLAPKKDASEAAAEAADKSGKGKGKMEVTINKIEVQSDDPDRFVAGMATALADLARNPTSALGTFEER